MDRHTVLALAMEVVVVVVLLHLKREVRTVTIRCHRRLEVEGGRVEQEVACYDFLH